MVETLKLFFEFTYTPEWFMNLVNRTEIYRINDFDAYLDRVEPEY